MKRDSPQGMKKQPVANVVWVKRELLTPNNYNPNNVAPKEMELLKFSILKLGWVFPILVMRSGEVPVMFNKDLGVLVAKPKFALPIIDGFHRWTTSGDNEVGRLTDGYVPIVLIPESNVEMITVMMNRAKGSHNVLDMAGIVETLIRRGVQMGEIMAHMGMSEEEVIRLANNKGIPKSKIVGNKFSEAWKPK